MDALLGMPNSLRGNTLSLLCRDCGSHRIKSYPGKRNTAAAWVTALYTFMRDTALRVNDQIFGPQFIQTDSGPVTKGTVWNQFLIKCGIRSRKSPPYRHNYWIEQAQRVVVASAMSMLHAAPLAGLGVPRERLWDEALNHSCDIAALFPSGPETDRRSAIEREGKPDLTGEELEKWMPAPWGAKCLAAFPREARNGHTSPHVRVGYFVGNDTECPLGTYRVFMPDTMKIIITSE